MAGYSPWVEDPSAKSISREKWSGAQSQPAIHFFVIPIVANIDSLRATPQARGIKSCFGDGSDSEPLWLHPLPAMTLHINASALIGVSIGGANRAVRTLNVQPIYIALFAHDVC